MGINLKVGRRGCSTVSVRVVGRSSLAWIEAAFLWGAKLEAVVMDNGELNQHLRSTYGCLPVSLNDAKSLPPRGPWTGIPFGTVLSDQEASAFASVFAVWLPRDAVLVAHGTKSRSEVLKWIPQVSGRYRMKLSKLSHDKFGGVTSTAWHLVHLSRATEPMTASTLMTEDHYAQTLQASLDDTAAKFRSAYSFEPCAGRDYIGEVRVRDTGALLRTFDADGLGPDLHFSLLLGLGGKCVVQRKDLQANQTGRALLHLGLQGEARVQV